jgi:hypothetical protein
MAPEIATEQAASTGQAGAAPAAGVAEPKRNAPSVQQLAANLVYDQVAAFATADKKECARGDKEQCLKFQRVSIEGDP